MRKVFLEQNLGKKSKCRFPKRNQKQVVIKLMIESQKAVSSPSLTQPLVIAGVSVIEFCDRFNQETVNLENGLKLRSKITVNSASKSFDLELMNPSVYQLMKRIFQLDNIQTMKKKNYTLAQVIHNIALIKLIGQLGNSYYLSDLYSSIKQVAGNLRSYDIRLARMKRKKWQHINN